MDSETDRGRRGRRSPRLSAKRTRSRSGGDPATLSVTWSGVDELWDEWPELAQRSGSIFGTREWVAAWIEHFGRDRSISIAVCRRDDGSLAAVVPLYVDRRGPLRVLRFIGSGPGDQLGPICDRAHPELAAESLRLAVGDGRLRWDVFLAERLPGGPPWASALGDRLLGREESPVVPFRGRTWEEFLSGRSSNFREQVRRRERRLRREHEVRFRLTEDPALVDHDLRTLIALHRARWGSEGSGAFDGAREAFHVSFARAALERGWLRLWTLEVDDKAVAAWYGFRFGDAESYYQSGRDPEWERESVGFVLLAHTIREAMQDGLTEYRFLRGGEGYKGRFAEVDPGLHTFAAARGALGHAALAGASAGLHLPGPLRSRLTALVR